MLDEHVDVRVARALSRRAHDVVAIRDWQGGRYRSRPDAEIILAARADARVLVTYDVGTIPTTLRSLIERGEWHAGVVLVSTKTIAESEVGAR